MGGNNSSRGIEWGIVGMLRQLLLLLLPLVQGLGRGLQMGLEGGTPRCMGWCYWG